LKLAYADEMGQGQSVPGTEETKTAPKVVMAPEAASAAASSQQESEAADEDEVTVEVME
jgi:hypothetical protein